MHARTYSATGVGRAAGRFESAGAPACGLPAAELAVTVHRGAHRDLGISHGQPGAYVTDHALAVAGPVREAYLVGPRDTADQDSWRTEIGSPSFSVSPA
jgi:hypothetical protein